MTATGTRSTILLIAIPIIRVCGSFTIEHKEPQTSAMFGDGDIGDGDIHLVSRFFCFLPANVPMPKSVP